MEQVAQVAGGAGLGDAQHALDVADAQLILVHEQGQDGEAGRIGERFEDPGHVFERSQIVRGVGHEHAYTRLSEYVQASERIRA